MTGKKTVGSWDPALIGASLTGDVVQRLTKAAALDDSPFGLSPEEITSLAPVARDGGPGSPVDWGAVADGLDDATIESLIRLLTRTEMAFPGWKGGDRSPVIALAAVLRRRGAWPAGLTAWIRANSDNRFLPHGSLARRL
jgi:hypothetical protein